MRARVCPENRQLFCSIFFGTQLLRDTNSNMVNFVFQHGRLWPLRTFVVSPWLVTDVIVTLVYAKVRYCGWCNHCIRILLQWPLHENSDAETTGWFNAALLPTLPPPTPEALFSTTFPKIAIWWPEFFPFPSTPWLLVTPVTLEDESTQNKQHNFLLDLSPTVPVWHLRLHVLVAQAVPFQSTWNKG